MLRPELRAVVLGLLSAIAMGAADFTGGMATRRVRPGLVIAVSHAFGLLLLTALATSTGAPAPSLSDLGWAAGAGVASLGGLAALYRGMALGRMGLVAPVSGVLAAALPVSLTVYTRGWPSMPQLGGFALGLVGIWLLSRARDKDASLNGLGLALWAGVGFGMFFVLLAQVKSQSVLWALVAARATSCTMASALVVVRDGGAAFASARALLPLLLVTGVLDIAGNGFFALAAQSGRLDIAAVVSSLYPGSTILLAWVVLRERLDRGQLSGILAALVAIVLITME